MAYEGQQNTFTWAASADLSAKQYYAVKMSGDDTVTVCSGTTDKPVGILQNDPTSGDAAIVCIAGLTKVSSDAALSRGDKVGTSGDGQTQPLTGSEPDTVYVYGNVVKASTAANGIATINCDFGNLNLTNVS